MIEMPKMLLNDRSLYFESDLEYDELMDIVGRYGLIETLEHVGSSTMSWEVVYDDDLDAQDAKDNEFDKGSLSEIVLDGRSLYFESSLGREDLMNVLGVYGSVNSIKSVESIYPVDQMTNRISKLERENKELRERCDILEASFEKVSETARAGIYKEHGIPYNPKQ